MASTKPLPRCRKCGGEPILKSEPTYFWGPPQHRMFCSSCGNGSQRYCFDSEIIAIQEWKKMNQTDENEWVMITDPKHVVRQCDQLSDYGTQWYGPSDLTGALGKTFGTCGFRMLRCRRKDLPPQAEPVKPVHPMCAAMADAAFVPLMHEQADGTICTKSGTIIVPLPDGTLHETAGYIVDLKPASPKMASAGGPGYAGLADLKEDLLTATCPVTGQVVKLTREQQEFFAPWMGDDGTFKCNVPLVPKDGYRFIPRDEPVIEGDLIWYINAQEWEASRLWKKDPPRQSTPDSIIGPYIRKITAAIIDNGDNPNCGSVKPVKRGELHPVDASKLPSIPQEVLADRSDWREQAAAWSELVNWCCRNGFEPWDNRYSGLTELQTLAQWILDLKAAANKQPHVPEKLVEPSPITRTTLGLAMRHVHNIVANWADHDPEQIGGMLLMAMPEAKADFLLNIIDNQLVGMPPISPDAAQDHDLTSPATTTTSVSGVDVLSGRGRC